MNLSMSLVNRLHLGRRIAAEVTCNLPCYRAWLLIQPVIGEREVIDTEASIEPRIASPTDNPVDTF